MNRKYSAAIQKIAEQENISAEFIYSEIQKAIEAGYNNPEPEVQEYWRKIAPDGRIPAPEELIEILSREIELDIK